MSAAFQRIPLEPGELIFQTGDPGDALFVVERGSVEIWRGSGSARWTLGYVETDDMFGEMSIFDKKPRMANASAGPEGAVVMRMPASVLRAALVQCDPMLRRLIEVMLQNMRRLAAQVDQHKLDERP